MSIIDKFVLVFNQIKVNSDSQDFSLYWNWKSIHLGGVRIECDRNKILPMVNLQRAINIAASRVVTSVRMNMLLREHRLKKEISNSG